ncbi:hypothetical protein B0H13DRAFT_1893301 [Mycena leptocephala]|nr:hypothetical protein B0H13DRAFT_1893301 [Mycena leptocephala]
MARRIFWVSSRIGSVGEEDKCARCGAASRIADGIEEVVEPVGAIDGTEDGYEKKLRAELENGKMGSGALGLLGLLISEHRDLNGTKRPDRSGAVPVKCPSHQCAYSPAARFWHRSLHTSPRPGHAPSDSLSNHPSRTPAKVASHVPAALLHPKIAGRAVESNHSKPCFRTLALEMKRLGLKLSDDRDSFKLPVDVESTVEFLKQLHCRRHSPFFTAARVCTPSPHRIFGCSKVLHNSWATGSGCLSHQQINCLEHYLEQSSADYPLPPSDAFFALANEENDEEWVDTRKKIMDETIVLGKMRSLLDERQIFDEERRAWKVRAILQDLGELQSDL